MFLRCSDSTCNTVLDILDRALQCPRCGDLLEIGLDLKSIDAARLPRLWSERKLSPETHLVLQGYVSPSIYTRDDTELDELLDMKYQLSIGVYRRFGRGVLSFAFTENLQNFNNTPDVGLQLGWAYSPALANRGD